MVRVCVLIGVLSALSLSAMGKQSGTRPEPPALKVAGWSNAPKEGFKLESARGKVVLLAFLSGFC